MNSKNSKCIWNLILLELHKKIVPVSINGFLSLHARVFGVGVRIY